MVKKKKNRKSKRGDNNKLSSIERMLKRKAEAFLKAEKDFWKYRFEIEEQYRKNAEAFELDFSKTIPDDVSTIIWGLKDGVAFVRYSSPKKKGRVEFRAWDITLEQWGNDGLIVPTPEGEISLARSGFIKGLGNITIHKSNFNGLEIPYFELSHAFYDSKELPEPIESAILDFQLAFLGLHFNSNQGDNNDSNQFTADNTISQLKDMSNEFEQLLSDAKKEEELQVFLKNNPIVLHPTAEMIPKKKLGEDFITDFVLVSSNNQGPTYTLVEIEKSSHPILTKENSLSSKTNHAIKQTRDWDVWLETNKAYFQGKLPGFETPQYLVVIGRGNKLDDMAKSYLRSYNRDWNNIELLTYDDVLVRFNGVISALESIKTSRN